MTALAAEVPMPERRCAGTTTRDGGRECNVAPDLLIEDEQTPGRWWCYSHHPAYEEERQASRSRGGLRQALKAKRFRYLDDTELGALATAADAVRWSVLVARGLATGRLGSAAGSAVRQSIETFLRSLEAVTLEERVAAVEQRLAERDAEAERAKQARADAQRPGNEYLSSQHGKDKS